MRSWSLDDDELEAAEHETVIAPESLIGTVPPETWSSLRLSVARPLGMGMGSWAVSAGSYVGVAKLVGTDRSRQVRLRPKIDADLFFMADWAFGGVKDVLAITPLEADLKVLRLDPVACMLAWYIGELERFASAMASARLRLASGGAPGARPWPNVGPRLRRSTPSPRPGRECAVPVLRVYARQPGQSGAQGRITQGIKARDRSPYSGGEAGSRSRGQPHPTVARNRDRSPCLPSRLSAVTTPRSHAALFADHR